MTFDYGMKDENPIDHVRFYVKDEPHKPVQVRQDQVCACVCVCVCMCHSMEGSSFVQKYGTQLCVDLSMRSVRSLSPHPLSLSLSLSHTHTHTHIHTQVSQMLPEKFMEQSIRVYCRKTDPESIKTATK